MSLILQWCIVVPLAAAYFTAVWLSAAREVREMQAAETDDSKIANPPARAVLSKIGFGDWAAGLVLAIVLVELVVRTARSLT